MVLQKKKKNNFVFSPKLFLVYIIFPVRCYVKEEGFPLYLMETVMTQLNQIHKYSACVIEI